MVEDKKNTNNENNEDNGNIDWENLKIPAEVISLVPYEAAKQYQFVPLERDKQVLRVGTVDDESIEVQNALKFLAEKNHLSIEIIKISEKNFNKALETYTNPSLSLTQALETIIDQEKTEAERNADQTIKIKQSEEEKVVRDAPVAKIVEVILRNAIEGGASDIHIEPLEESLRVRYRMDGVLHNSLMLPKNIGPAVISRIKILSNLKIDEKRKPQDGRFRILELGKQIDLRVSSLPVSLGEKIVMRVLDKEKGLIKLEDLGVVGRNYQIVKQSIEEPYGMILITGPTGSGKSTTLYAILKIMNKEGINIVTLEDPVEYALEGVNQSQVKPEIGYTFAAGLRSILRQDPDVIMVGEIRDKETAELAIHAALTGHIVLSTLHTNDSIGAIPRLIDMGVEPFLITSSLRMVAAQRLVRKICDHCKEEVKITESLKEAVDRSLSQIPEDQKKEIDFSKGFKIFRGKGCPKCGGSGTKGRIGIYEIFSVTDEIANLMGERVDDEALRKAVKTQGMISMKQDGILKVLQGITSMEEIERVTEEETLAVD